MTEKFSFDAIIDEYSAPSSEKDFSFDAIIAEPEDIVVGDQVSENDLSTPDPTESTDITNEYDSTDDGSDIVNELEDTLEYDVPLIEFERRQMVVASYNVPSSRHTNETNEDFILNDQASGSFAVIDGMGGEGNNPRHVAEKLQTLLADNLRFKPTSYQELIDGMHIAFVNAREALRASIALSGSGAVATAIKIADIDGRVYMGVAHAGDTRLVLARPETGNFRAITEDQCHGNIVDNGFAKGLDGSMDRFGAIELTPGTRIALLSDGITGDWGPDNPYGYPNQLLSDAEYQDAFAQRTPAECIKRLVSYSKKDDDTSAIVIDIV